MDQEIKPLKGTTTVGIVCNGGIVLAADKRASAGYFVAHKKEDKIKKISDHMAITTAGLVSDAQLFTRIIRAQLKLLKLRKNKEPTVKESANLLANLSYANIRRPSMVPGIVGFLLGGVDRHGEHLYSIGVDGSVSLHDDYVSDGSGSRVAIGVLETLFKPEMTLEEGQNVALRAVNAALQRDLATGNGIDIFTVTPKGVTQVLHKEINTNVI